ncbi:hypothetical protein L21SP5_00118 [Salinivirga cyanobacteriivorans]|uniref:Uncharacterized protein n=1 Tax=Salinivirga cyanobacteriivorans TaxID=1307839 RepID=A0A0S2HUR0_9BACT|nr:hypothetical protein [Salinivirga cyanobacteriivorans]ALO13800.1 hypothetical protein L21SP5_00118 [Salinivirga cyanobacteriivorans]
MKYLLVSMLFYASLCTYGQVYPPPFKFVGYIDSLPAFYSLEEKSVFTINQRVRNFQKKYPAGIIPQRVEDDFEVLYSFEDEIYTVNIEGDTYSIKNKFESIAVDVHNKTLYATLRKTDSKHPKGIIRKDLVNKTTEYIGYDGYVERIVGDNIFLYKETYPETGSSPFKIIRLNIHTKKELLVFEDQSLILDFQISRMGKYVFAENGKEYAIIDLDDMSKQLIALPMQTDVPPFFSFNNQFLVFYHFASLKMEKVKVD